MDNSIMLCNLPIGKNAVVTKLFTTGRNRRRMLDLGLVENSKIKAIRKSPCGDPTAYKIKGAVIALRKHETSKIMVIPIN